jgi:hypothetical protein
MWRGISGNFYMLIAKNYYINNRLKITVLNTADFLDAWAAFIGTMDGRIARRSGRVATYYWL